MKLFNNDDNMSHTPKICLNLMVKDESRVIRRCLNAVLPHVDCAVVCDTGSADDTVALVKDACGSHGKPVEIHAIPFTTFGETRNRTLELTRRSSMPFDYILMLDADLSFRGSIDRSKLGQPAYSMDIRSGEIVYQLPRLIRRDVPFKFVGPVHEYIQMADGTPSAKLEGCSIDDLADGSGSATRFQRNITLLQKGLEAEPNNARLMFYLARDLQCTGDINKAMNWYDRRIMAGGCDEEVWYAKYQYALCCLKPNDMDSILPNNFVEQIWIAYNSRPWRAEPLYKLAKHYRETNQHDSCCAVCEVGLKIPYPKDDVLFIEESVYRWRFQEELSISGYYSKLPERQKIGRTMCESLANGEIPSNRGSQQLAASNLLFYLKRGA